MIHQNFRQGTGFSPYLLLCVTHENTLFFLHVLHQPTSYQAGHSATGCNAELATGECGQCCPLVASRAIILRILNVNPFLHLQRTRVALTHHIMSQVVLLFAWFMINETSVPTSVWTLYGSGCQIFDPDLAIRASKETEENTRMAWLRRSFLLGKSEE